MSFDYSRARATAERLIERYGRTATLVVPTSTGPAHDRVGGEPLTYSIRVVDLDVQHTDRSGELVLATRRTLYVSTTAGTGPQKSHFVDLDGTRYPIRAVRPLKPGPVTIMWEVDI